MRFAIRKCHGSGNDFPLIDARDPALADTDWPMVARALADRRGAVGGDGLLLLTPGSSGCAFGMRMFNSDGSEAETCLNGLRCVARAGFEALAIDRATVHLRMSVADAAVEPAMAPGVATIRTLAGPASLDVAGWPLRGEGEAIVDRPVTRLSPTRAFTAVAMPNPHLVAFVAAIDEDELVRIGAACEAAPDWLPNRANVSFVRVDAPDALYVRTFERGVGLTDSCGSAMAAATHAAALTGRTAFAREIRVRNRGGFVRACASADGMVAIAGNATWEWDGEVRIDPATGIACDLTVLRDYPAERADWADVIATAPDRPAY